jgi:CRISPR/Cas system Type II protein with McrA/HNH and RuvC-like nuclease domain
VAERVFTDRFKDYRKKGTWGWSIFQLTDGHCAYCGHELDFDGLWHLDHIIPRSQGGKNQGNLIAACERCNLRKGPETPREFQDHIRYKMYKTLRRLLPDVEEFCGYCSSLNDTRILPEFVALLNLIAGARIEFYHDFSETRD